MHKASYVTNPICHQPFAVLQAMLQWKAKTLAEQPKFFSPTRQREQELFELGYRRVAGRVFCFESHHSELPMQRP